MKNPILFFCLVVSILSHAQKGKLNPPNTLKINDSLYIDQSPVTNLMYLEFLDMAGRYWNYTFHDTINKILPSKLNNELLTKNMNKKESRDLKEYLQLPEYKNVEDYLGSHSYLRNSKYVNAPVVFIHKKQAELYCLWRSDMVNIMLNKKNKKTTEIEYVNYRLPTESELNNAIYFFQHTVFSESGAPSKMKAKKDEFTIFKLSEFTSSNTAFESYPNWKGMHSDNETANNFTSFRCICETAKR